MLKKKVASAKSGTMVQEVNDAIAFYKVLTTVMVMKRFLGVMVLMMLLFGCSAENSATEKKKESLLQQRGILPM